MALAKLLCSLLYDFKKEKKSLTSLHSPVPKKFSMRIEAYLHATILTMLDYILGVSN